MSNALTQQKAALEFTRGERPKLVKKVEDLGKAKTIAARALERAQLNVYVAHGTPDRGDDAAAAAAVRIAKDDFESVCAQLDRAEESLAALDRAEKTLVAEIGRMEGAARMAHIERSKVELRKRIDAKAATLAALIAEIAAARTLAGVTSWPQEVHQALEEALRKPEDRDPMPNRLVLAIREGQGMADRIRAGATVEEVCP